MTPSYIIGHIHVGHDAFTQHVSAAGPAAFMFEVIHVCVVSLLHMGHDADHSFTWDMMGSYATQRDSFTYVMGIADEACHVYMSHVTYDSSCHI